MSAETVNQFMPNRKSKNSKSKAKTPCKCLTCANPHRETHDGVKYLICGDEACNLKCELCTERPPSGQCGFKPLPVVDEVCEGVRMQA